MPAAAAPWVAAASAHSKLITNLNLPGSFVWGFAALLARAGGAVKPEWMPMDAWRGLTLPFFGIPAWWFAGFSLDCIRARRAVPRLMRWVGIALAVLFLFGTVGELTAPARDRVEMDWFLPGLILWTAAFALAPVSQVLARKPQMALQGSEVDRSPVEAAR